MTTKVAPQVLKGMRDFLPSRMILRQYVVRTLTNVFERFGFEPLETPALEYADTLEGKYGEEADRLLYRFEDRGGRRIGLRYDLTVPLARVVAMYPELGKPFKRYQMGPVWRAEKPQRGRYREFWQCDVDIVGSSSMLADAEVVTVAYTALCNLGFRQFRIKINDRKVLTALGIVAGVPDQFLGTIYRSIDKLEKIGEAAVRAEMERGGVPSDAIDRLMNLVLTPVESAADLDTLSGRLSEAPTAAEGIAELKQLLSALQVSGLAPENYQIDLSMVRGLDYYTGPIFEVVVDEPKIGTITAGGRYDRLVGMFAGRDIPAVGISVGLERIIDVLEELQLAPESLGKTITQVLVTVFGPEMRDEALRLTAQLREAGVRTEVYLDEERLQHQLGYASRKQIPYVVLLGPDELTHGVAVVRNMNTREQITYDRDALVAALRAQLLPTG